MSKKLNYLERQNLPTAVAFLIVTAVPVERDAVLKVMKPLDGEEKVAKTVIDDAVYYVGKIGKYSCALVMCHMGSIGWDSSIMATKIAIDNWLPTGGVIMPGIAFGRWAPNELSSNPNKQVIGDVLVATQVIPYESQRRGKDGIIPRAAHPETSLAIHNRLRNLDWSWKHKPSNSRRQMQFGPLLSGEKLVDDPAFKKELFEQHQKAIGGEMEGAGVYSASARAKKEWIILKAICDWGDGTKAKDSQPMAAKNAVSVVEKLLSEPGFPVPDSDLSRSTHTKSLDIQAKKIEEVRSSFLQKHDSIKRLSEGFNSEANTSLSIPEHVQSFIQGEKASLQTLIEKYLTEYDEVCGSFLSGGISESHFNSNFAKDALEFIDEYAEVTEVLTSTIGKTKFNNIHHAHDRIQKIERLEKLPNAKNQNQQPILKQTQRPNTNVKRKTKKLYGNDFGVRPKVLVTPNFEFPSLLHHSLLGLGYGMVPQYENLANSPFLAFLFKDSNTAEKCFDIFLGWQSASDGNGDAVAINFIEFEDGGYGLCVSPERTLLIERALPAEIRKEVSPRIVQIGYIKRFEERSEGYYYLKENAQKKPILVFPSVSRFGDLQNMTFVKKQINFWKESEVPEGTIEHTLIKRRDDGGAETQTDEFTDNREQFLKEDFKDLFEYRARQLSRFFPITLERLRLSEQWHTCTEPLILEGARKWQLEQAACNLVIRSKIQSVFEGESVDKKSMPMRVLNYLLAHPESLSILDSEDSLRLIHTENLRSQIIEDAIFLIEQMSEFETQSESKQLIDDGFSNIQNRLRSMNILEPSK